LLPKANKKIIGEKKCKDKPKKNPYSNLKNKIKNSIMGIQIRISQEFAIQ
jgi:hypothetical protein